MSDWTNTGLVRYTGNDITYNNIRICNGDLLTDVILKIKQIIDSIDAEITLAVNIPGCLTIDTNSINTILQDLINYTAEIKCTEIAQINSSISILTANLSSLVNTVSSLHNITIVDNSGSSISQSGNQYTFNGFVPIGGIIYWNGTLNSFLPSGIGTVMSGMSNWALCDGRNGSPDLSEAFIKGTTTCGVCIGQPSGDPGSMLRLSSNNIPKMTVAGQTININGATSTNGSHTHEFWSDGDISAGTTTHNCIEVSPDSTPSGKSKILGGGSGLILEAGAHNHVINLNATISTGTVGQDNAVPISVEPYNVRLIPIIRIS